MRARPVARAEAFAASTIPGRSAAAAPLAIRSRSALEGSSARCIYFCLLPCAVCLLDRQRIYRELPRAATEAFDRHVHLVHQRDEQVRHRRLVGVRDVAAAFEASSAA